MRYVGVLLLTLTSILLRLVTLSQIKIRVRENADFYLYYSLFIIHYKMNSDF